MYSFVSPFSDALEGALRYSLARRNLRGLPELQDLTPNWDFTIIIAAYNEASRESNIPGKSRIERHLEILDCWKEKIILVDDGSTDNTAEVARAAGYNVFRCEQNGRKSGSVLKLLKLLKNEYVVALDLDSYPDAELGTLENIARLVGWVQSQNMGGACITLLPYVRERRPLQFKSPSTFIASLRDRGSYYLETIQTAEYMLSMRSTKGSQTPRHKERVMTISGGFGVYRRDGYIQACSQFINVQQRLFSLEDVFNTTVLNNLGLRTGYYPITLVRTEAPCDLVSLFDQRNKWECANLRNTMYHMPTLLRDPGRREETAWNVFHDIVLRPVKYLTTGPLIGYGLAHPWFLLGFYLISLAVMTGMIRANTSAKEFRQIREVIPLIPLYSLLLNSLVYSKAWLEEVVFQSNVWLKQRLHPTPKPKLDLWLDSANVYLRSDSTRALDYATYQGLIGIAREAEKDHPDHTLKVQLLDNPDDEAFGAARSFEAGTVVQSFKAKYHEISRAYLLSFDDQATGERISVALGLTNHTAAVVSSINPSYTTKVFEYLSGYGDMSLNFQEFAPKLEDLLNTHLEVYNEPSATWQS